MLMNEEVPALDPLKVLESVVTELEVLCADTPPLLRGDLISLHGALLAYGLGGDASLIPERSLGLSGRRLLEVRVIRAARRLCGSVARGADENQSEAVLDAAAQRIDDLIHLIDPELRVSAA